MLGLDFSNPVVVVLAALVILLGFDLVMAGGGMTSGAACGLACAASTPVGWIALLLVVVVVLLAAGAVPALPGGPAPAIGADGWWILALVAVPVLALGLVLASRRGGRDRRQPGARTPEALLRERYARGQVSRQQLRESLVDVLKDRYVRGELDLATYESQLARLLEEPRTA